MQLYLNVRDVNGLGLLSSFQVQALVSTVINGVETPQDGIQPPVGIGRPERSFGFADTSKVRITLSGPNYPRVDFFIAADANDTWAVEISGMNDAEKEIRRILAKAYVRIDKVIGDLGPIVQVTVVMPRLWPAPFGPSKFTGAPGAEPGTIIKRHGGVVAFGGRYLDLNLRKEDSFHLVEREMLKPPIDAKSEGWGRFQSTTTTVDPAKDLWFRLVEYGGANMGPRFLVALCGPAKGLVHDAAIDVVLYYSPGTIVQDEKRHVNIYPPSRYPFRDDYPYVEAVAEAKDNWNQPYCSLGFAYLALDGLRGGYRMAHQLFAAKKAALIVMPIWPYGNLGPFRTRAGAWRLVREASYFAYGMREQDDQPQTPRTNRMVVCGYSAGVDFVGSLLEADKDTIEDGKGQGYQRALWGAKADEFPTAWKEMWVLDAKGGLGALNRHKLRLAKWFRDADDRRLRLYQTQYTVGPTYSPSEDLKLKGDPFTMLFGTTPSINIVKDEKGLRLAEEIHSTDGRVSAVYFSNPFLDFPSGSDLQSTDSHHAIPRFTFGHAARISGLRPLP